MAVSDRARTMLTLSLGLALGAAISHAAQPPAKGGYVLERDSEVAKTEPGTPGLRRLASRTAERM